MAQRVKRRVDTSFLAWWTVACVIGLTFGGALGVIVGEHVGYPIGAALNAALDVPEIARDAVSSGMAGLLNGLVPAVCAAVTQWLVLTRYLRRAVGWLPATFVMPAVLPAIVSVASAMLPAVTGNRIEPLLIMTVGWFVANTINGLVSGALQWLVLRGATPRAAWWVVISLVLFFGLTFVQMPLGLLCLAYDWDVVRYACNVGTGVLSQSAFGFASGLAFLWMFAGIEPDPVAAIERVSPT